MPTTPQAPYGRPTDEPRRAVRVAGALRTPAGAGALVMVVLASALAVGGLLGGPSRPTGSVAATSPSPAAVASASTGPGASSANPGSGPTTVPASGGSGNPGSAPPTPAAPSASTVPVTPAPEPTPSLDPRVVPAQALQARLDRLRAKLRIPGVSVAILWDDGREWLGVSGSRDLATGDPMTGDTAFALASISKTFTAAVVLQLVEEGRLSLDERVAPLLPDYDLDPNITVRQLLDHTSGLPDFFLNGRIDRPLQSDKGVTWTAQQAWAYVAPPRKRFRPGRVWMYSNSNYLLLGELVQAATGRSLAREIRRRLLDPLGLDSAWYQAVEKPRARGTVAYRLVASADGLRAVPVAKASEVMPFRSVVTAAGGAGSIAATARDAARWMRAFAGGDVLSPAMQQAMVGDVASTAKLRAEIPYGLGIQAVPVAGRYALGHSGRFLGFRNVARYLPGEGITIAVLTNQGLQDPARIAQGLLRVILPPLAPVPGATPSPSPSSPTP